jgi:lysophospholipase L1-like esterase
VSLWRKLIFSALIIGLALGGLEGGLRLVGYRFNPYRQFMLGVAGEAEAEFDQTLFWRPARPPDLDLERRPAGKSGVLVLSDSVGVQSNYPDLLRRALKNRLKSHGVVVHNANVTGYTSFQGLRLLEQRVAAARPDVVVVNFGFNDHWNSGNKKTDKEQPPPSNTLSRWVGRSRLLGLVASQLLRFRSDQYQAFPLSSLGEHCRVPLDDYDQNLRRFVALSGQHGFRLLLMTSPFLQHKPKPGENWIPLHQSYNDIVRAVCKARPEVLCLDMVEALRHQPALWQEANGAKDPVHFNEQGGKLVAARLAKILAPVLNQKFKSSVNSTDLPTPAEEAPLGHREFSDAAAALEHLLDRHDPLVLAFGEYHQKSDSVKVRSAVRRFGDELVEPLSLRASDLVVETWMPSGKCGAQEEKVVAQVETATKRPDATESEVIRLLKRAKAAGIRPHILEVGCDEYKQLLGAGEVDYVKLLTLIARHLQGKAERLLKLRATKPLPATKTIPSRRLVAIYGGALHNDLYPLEDLKDFTFGAALKQRAAGRYLELDLYVPEYVEGNEDLAGERWFPLLKLTSPDGVVLIERGAGSYILLLKRGVKS